MSYILLIAIVLNTSLSYSIYFNKKIEETIFLSILGKILILFLTGVTISLEIGFYLIILLNIILFIYNILNLWKNKNIIKTNILTIGLWLFLISCLLFIWITYGRVAVVWDEFSHWALVVKNMYGLNNFGIGPDGTVMAKNYLSGTSLFQYFATKLSGEFNESILYFSMDLMVISFVLPMFKNIKKYKKISPYLIFLLVLFIPTIFYPDIYNTLYVDAILGIAFSYALYSYLLNYNDGLNKFNLINLSASLLMLIFIKEIGLVLAFLVLVIILLDNLFIRNKFEFNIKKIWNENKLILLTFLPLIIVKILWIVYMNNYDVNSLLDNNSIFDAIKNLLFGNITPTYVEVGSNFIKSLFYHPLVDSSYLTTTYVSSIGIFIASSYIIIINLKKEKTKSSYILSNSLIVLGALGYALMLLLSYLSVFSEYEASRLASFQRYISTYSLGMLLLVSAQFLNNFSLDNKKQNAFLITLFIALIYFGNHTAYLNTIFARINVNNSYEVRQNYQIFKNKINKYVEKDERIYFISTDDKGFDYWVSRYEITPKKMNLNYGWSIGNKYNEEDIWTIFKTTEEWKQELFKDYDYVYLFDIDEPFIQQYGELFSNSIENNQLYKINKNISNVPILQIIK